MVAHEKVPSLALDDAIHQDPGSAEDIEGFPFI
jgi:hypothetical protein